MDVASEESFRKTLAAARSGQEWAWTSIYRELAPPLLGYLRARGAAEPDDLLGELFLQIIRDVGSFEGEQRDFRAWAFAIAHHRLIDDRRYRARRPVEPAWPETLIENQALAQPEEPWPQGIEDPQIRAALRRLPEEQRNVVLLRIIGDLSAGETGRVLGKSAGAVRALQRRALASLRREIAKSTVTP